MTVGRVLLVLLGIWVLMAVIGVIIKGLFWLFVIALILFGFTLAGGAKRTRFGSRR
ncbi:MAG: hypothetical protein ACR2LX_03555 [Jatrophihabitans sp.]